MTEPLWRLIARCGQCKKILNMARNVPESEKSKVEMQGPLMAICDVKAHNSMSDLNLGVQLIWEREGLLLK